MKQYTFKDGFKCVASTREEAIAKHKVIAKALPVKVKFNKYLSEKDEDLLTKDKLMFKEEVAFGGDYVRVETLKAAQRVKELLSKKYKVTIVDSTGALFTKEEKLLLKNNGFSHLSDNDEEDCYSKKNFLNIKGLYADIYKQGTNKYKVNVYFDNDYDALLPRFLTYFEFSTKYIVKNSLKDCFAFFKEYEKIITDLRSKVTEYESNINKIEKKIKSLR